VVDEATADSAAATDRSERRPVLERPQGPGLPRPDALTTSVGLLGLAVVAYLLVPLDGVAAELAYMSVGALAICAAALGVRRHQPRRRAGWNLVLAGFGIWVLGDLVWTIEYTVLGSELYPGFSDAVYLVGYGVLTAGGMVMIRSRAGRDSTALLDGAIVAVGVGVALWVFAIAPTAGDTTTSLAARVVFAVYPLADLLLLVVMVRLWTSPGASTWSFRLLVSAFATTFAADVVFAVPAGQAESLTTPLEALWLGGYVLLAAAAVAPSMLTLAEAPPIREERTGQGRSIAVLSLALMLPPAVLVATGLADRAIPWEVIAGGSLTLSALVLARMSGLVRQVQAQSVQLAALARRDPLTGAPNRRSWDHELSRACARARDLDSILCVAVLDLDHFKAYNDTYGHPAGDRLLREAVAAWSEVVGTTGVLARFGGEEFTLLVEDVEAADVKALLERMQAVTPGGQTFSAGVARWDVDSSPQCVVAQADEALYEAKRAGRRRVLVHEASRDSDTQASPADETPRELRPDAGLTR
jgi:diguanylate cyclase (GGDEF)-like protein